MAKPGRRKGRRNRGYFYRKGRGWVASDRGKMVPITFPDGTPKQEEAMLKYANRALRIAIKVCIRTGARYFSEFCKLTRRHVKDHGDRMEWVFQPQESKTKRLRTIRITDPEVLKVVREQMKWHRSGPIFRSSNGKPWTRNNLCRRFVGQLPCWRLLLGAGASVAG